LKNLDLYLRKAGESIEDFLMDTKILTHPKDKEKESGWCEYEVCGDIFWIRTLFHEYEDRKKSQEDWEELKKFAVSMGCKKIQFTTSRDGKAWERLFKDMKVVQYKLEIEL
tara:strand:- start:304 stop:636 length:333 start_codon:yes stop_codon:yes gene_type:complete